MTYFDIAWGLLIIKDYLRIADYINIPDRLDDIFVICVCGIFCISIISKKYNIRIIYICCSWRVRIIYGINKWVYAYSNNSIIRYSGQG